MSILQREKRLKQRRRAPVRSKLSEQAYIIHDMLLSGSLTDRKYPVAADEPHQSPKQVLI